jgi:hypothetical protein
MHYQLTNSFWCASSVWSLSLDSICSLTFKYRDLDKLCIKSPGYFKPVLRNSVSAESLRLDNFFWPGEFILLSFYTEMIGFHKIEYDWLRLWFRQCLGLEILIWNNCFLSTLHTESLTQTLSWSWNDIYNCLIPIIATAFNECITQPEVLIWFVQITLEGTKDS